MHRVNKAVSFITAIRAVDNNESCIILANDNNDEQRLDMQIIMKQQTRLATPSSTNIESPLPIITMDDTNVDRIDGASSKEIDEQEVLGSSNYGTFNNLTQEHENDVLTEVADEQLAIITATDEFENEDMQPHQQSPVLIDIEEEVIQHNNNGRAQQRRRRYILLPALLVLLAAVATTLGILLGRNNNSSSDNTATLGSSNMNNNASAAPSITPSKTSTTDMPTFVPTFSDITYEPTSLPSIPPSSIEDTNTPTESPFVYELPLLKLNLPPAHWMSGKWGISWRIKAGDTKQIRNYNVTKLVEQVKSIPGVTYVLFGLSEGANGSRYIAPHSILSELNPRCCPVRDLFGELAEAFQKEGYKVLAYMATEGPAKLKHGKAKAYDYNEQTDRSPSIDRWKGYVRRRYGTTSLLSYKRAYADVIVREFANRYGTKIDGWWFDHASYGHMRLIHDICTEANPKVALAFNRGKLPSAANDNPDYEDFTSGHPTPVRKHPANSTENLNMVQQIEAGDNGYLYVDGKPSLGHMYMPMFERWNSGDDVVWTEKQAEEWMRRVLGTGGAWTWNVPSIDDESSLSYEGVEFATRVGLQLLKCKDTNWYTIANDNPRYCGSGFVSKRCEYDDLYGDDSYSNVLIAHGCPLSCGKCTSEDVKEEELI